MSTKIFKNASVFISDGDFVNASIYVNEGKVEAIINSYESVSCAEVIDCTDRLIVPGFIDIHIHGRCGFDTMNILKNPDEIYSLAKSMSGTGVTSFLPTTLTCDFDEYLQVLSHIAEYIDKQPKDCASIGYIFREQLFQPCAYGRSKSGFIKSRNNR